MSKPSANHSAAAQIISKHHPFIPKTGSPSAVSIKSLVRNILLASPDFPGLYQRVLVSEGYNPNEAKMLAEKYQKKEGPSMPFQQPKVCTHIKVTGVRCGSPALRGEQFCYFHQRMVRGVRTPPQSRLHPIALIESEEAIQASLMEVINALARNTIDLKRAELIIRSLHIAVKNAHRVKFQVQSEDMVKEVPDYPTPTAPLKPAPATVVESQARVPPPGACPKQSRRSLP